MAVGASGPNQVIENYAFDPQTGLITNQTATRGTATLLDLTYDYSRGNSVGSHLGKTGAVTKILDNIDHDRDKHYEYDALGRLTKVKGGTDGADWWQKYTYDRYGNRTNVEKDGNGIDSNPIPMDGLPNLAYDSASNRITSSGFQYDAAGNQITGFSENGTPIKLEYDGANRLQIVKRASDGVTIQAFQFTSTNARLMDWDATSGQLKIFASVGGIILAEYTELQHTIPTYTKGYTYLGGTLLATLSPTGTGSENVEFNHPDRISTRLITNPQTSASAVQTHLPFGKVLSSESTTSSSKKKFTSYDRSVESGLDYAINRTYDPKQGRFTQVDPIGMGAASLAAPQTLNLYTYCGNDPVNRVDPDGLFWGWIKKFFSWIINTIRTSKIVRRIVVRFVVSFVMSGGNLGVAVRSIVPEILAALGLAPPRFAVTPSWNPDLPYPVSFGGISSLSKYIIKNLVSALGGDTMGLSDCVKGLLQGIFSGMNLDNVKIHSRFLSGMPSNTTAGQPIGAITVGNNIYAPDDMEYDRFFAATWEDLEHTIHEVRHVQQYRSAALFGDTLSNPGGFITLYALSGFIHAMIVPASEALSAAYKNNDFETNARSFAKNAIKKLKREGKSPCPIEGGEWSVTIKIPK